MLLYCYYSLTSTEEAATKVSVNVCVRRCRNAGISVAKQK